MFAQIYIQIPNKSHFTDAPAFSNPFTVKVTEPLYKSVERIKSICEYKARECGF